MPNYLRLESMYAKFKMKILNNSRLNLKWYLLSQVFIELQFTAISNVKF